MEKFDLRILLDLLIVVMIIMISLIEYYKFIFVEGIIYCRKLFVWMVLC